MVTRCVCFERTFEELRRLCAERAWRSLEEVAAHTGCSTKCGLCGPYIARMLATGQTAFQPMSEMDGEGERA